MYHCPQCGDITGLLREGVCEPCAAVNQDALDLFNAEYDRWQRMSASERDDAIRVAMDG